MKERIFKLLERAYAPYSNFKVACLLVCKDGTIFEGVNVENASYGGTVCAERTALLSAVTKGYRKGDFEKIYIASSSNKETFPCFICRQTLIEFFNLDNEVVLISDLGETIYRMKELVPHTFLSEDLK